MTTLILKKKKRYIEETNQYSVINLSPYYDPTLDKSFEDLERVELLLRKGLIGKIFEKNLSKNERKSLGQFYTSREIVDYMLSFMKIQPNSKILDPSCGCGVFLVRLFDKLKNINPNPLTNIYGVDLNNSAVKITKLSLWLKGHNLEGAKEFLDNNIKVGNSIVSDNKFDKMAFDWKKEFSNIFFDGGFDIIIGNPPYVTLEEGKDYELNDLTYRKIADKTANAASLILAKSIEILKIGGIIAFVLPKSLIRVNSYKKLRNFILENCKILHIYDLGQAFKDVRGEQILLFLQKEKNVDRLYENKILITVFKNKNNNLYEQTSFYIPQKLYYELDNFLVLDNRKIYCIIEKLSGIKLKLKDISIIFRGIGISVNSPIISTHLKNSYKTIIKGNNIRKYRESGCYYVDEKRIDRKFNGKLKLLKNIKIILQNIFSSESGMIATIDNKNYTLDTATNIVLKNNLHLKYILALLNSKLINFYLINGIYNKSKLTMHTDQGYIGKIPIIIPKINIQTKINQLVDKILNKSDNNEVLKYYLREIDKLVFSIYGINMSEQEIIDKNLKEIMSKKSFW